MVSSVHVGGQPCEGREEKKDMNSYEGLSIYEDKDKTLNIVYWSCMFWSLPTSPPPCYIIFPISLSFLDTHIFQILTHVSILTYTLTWNQVVFTY